MKASSFLSLQNILTNNPDVLFIEVWSGRLFIRFTNNKCRIKSFKEYGIDRKDVEVGDILYRLDCRKERLFLLKKYHPDINKKGAQVTNKINKLYDLYKYISSQENIPLRDLCSKLVTKSICELRSISIEECTVGTLAPFGWGTFDGWEQEQEEKARRYPHLQTATQWLEEMLSI